MNIKAVDWKAQSSMETTYMQVANGKEPAAARRAARVPFMGQFSLLLGVPVELLQVLEDVSRVLAEETVAKPSEEKGEERSSWA